MSEFGIHTADHHLDVMENPPGQSTDGQQSEFRWDLFQTWTTNENWNGGSLPAFAGRYFLGGAPNQRHDTNGNLYQQPQFQWGHGEGQLAQADAPTLERIAPLQGADPDRQGEIGPFGLLYGTEDATALCQRLAACVVAGEFSVTNSEIYVFLDVADGSSPSADYWAGWADTVYHFMVPGQPAPAQPFLPCICCDFTEDPNTQLYSLDAQVAACLNTAQLDNPDYNARCWGFWAKAADPANMSQALDFTRFLPAYWQPMTTSGSQPVWVVIWRYAEQADPPTNFAGGNRVSLDATNEADTKTITLDRLLQIGNFALTDLNTRYLGADRGRPFTIADANCLGGQNLVPPGPQYIQPAQATRGAGQTQQQFSGNLTFVVRYYSTPGQTKLVTLPEIVDLHAAGLRVAAVWQIWGSLAEWSASNAGSTHALAAFTYAVAMQQAPNTPVYFSLDADPGTDPANRTIIETYFKDVLAGYQLYQQQQLANQVDPVPYAIGVYGAGVCLRYCYEQGIASFFWETGSTGWTESRALWPHASIVQTPPLAWAPCNFQLPGPNNIPPDTSVDFDASWGDEGAW